LTENTKIEEPSTPGPTTESSTARDLMMPFRVLVSPLRTFSQLAQKPTAKGLITLAVLIVVITAATQYASATRIILTIDGQPIGFAATDSFSSWFISILATTNFYIVLYWLVAASALALVGRFFGKKEVKLRHGLVILGYVLAVLVILYAVRTITYLALPPITFDIASWPPAEQATRDAVLNRMSQEWGSLPVYQFGSYFTLVSFVWLVILGAVAVKAMRDTSWSKSFLVSLTGFMIAVVIFGFP